MLVCASVVLAVAMFPAQAGQKKSPPHSQTGAVKRAQPAGRDEQALRKAIEAGDDSAGAHGELGLLLYRQGRFQEATLELGRAVQLDPSSPEYSLKLASAILADRRFSVALEFLQAVQDRFENLAEYQYNLGLGYFGKRNYRKAAASLQRATELAPNMDVAFFFLGNTYAADGALDKAVVSYRKALEINPNNAGFCLAMGKVLGLMGPEHDQEAIEWLRKALKLKPGDIASKFALGVAYERVDELAAAQTLLEDVVAKYPEERSAHYVLSRIYQKLNKTEKAEAERRIVERLTKSQNDRTTSGLDPDSLPHGDSGRQTRNPR